VNKSFDFIAASLYNFYRLNFMATGEPKKIIIDISSLTLLKILLITAALFFLYFIRDAILIIFVSLILASAFGPWLDWMQKHKIPRALGVLAIYIILFSIIFGAIYLIIPPIIKEINELVKSFPFYYEKIAANWQSFRAFSDSHQWSQNIQSSLNGIQSSLGLAAGNVFSTIFSFFGGIFSFFIILVLTFYMAVDDQAIKKTIRSVLPIDYQPYSMHLINRIQEKIGLWLRGQIFLSLVIFAVSWIGLSILGVKYALVLAVFAGVTEIIPYLGPFIGALPAVFIAFTQSPLLGIITIVLYIVIQQSENYFLVPKVMQKAVGLNPIIVIIAIMIGAKIAGILGVLLAVPVATAISVVVSDIFKVKEEQAITA